MAQFLFEADLHGLLKLDTPIPNAPPARWQRKAKESGPGPSPVGVSPMKPANRSHSSSKTPSKTPGEPRHQRRRLSAGASPRCLSVAMGLWAPCHAALPACWSGRRRWAVLLTVTHLLPGMRGRALSTGAGQLLIAQLSLAGTAACWDKCGQDCQRPALHPVTVFLYLPLIFGLWNCCTRPKELLLTVPTRAWFQGGKYKLVVTGWHEISESYLSGGCDVEECWAYSRENSNTGC